MFLFFAFSPAFDYLVKSYTRDMHIQKIGNKEAEKENLSVVRISVLYGFVTQLWCVQRC